MTLAGPEVREFALSLPPSYRDRYSRVSVEAHARLSAALGDGPFVLDLFEDGYGAEALALVTKDRPGVLALASSALTTHGFDIGDAQFYTRERPTGGREALALFWPQTRSGQRAELSAEDLAKLRETLARLFEGRAEDLPTNVVRLRPEAKPRKGPRPDTRVRFVEGNDGSLSVLEVETGDRTGLLLSLARALFSARVQIVSSKVRTVGDEVYDRFLITEPGGEPVSSERRLAIQVAVLSALDPNRS